jgi:hypothetical protein
MVSGRFYRLIYPIRRSLSRKRMGHRAGSGSCHADSTIEGPKVWINRAMPYGKAHTTPAQNR